MENIDLPPPYTAVIDVSMPSSAILIPPEVSVENEKNKIDEEPLIAPPFADKNTRVAFIQKILLYILLQAISTALMIFPFVYFFNGDGHENIYTDNMRFFVPVYGRIIILCVYLFVVGLLLACDKARTKNPYKTIIFAVYPIILAILISFSSLDYTREIFAAWSCYCVTIFALLAYSIVILQSSLDYRPDGGTFISVVVLSSLFALTTQIDVLDKTITLCYMTAMLLDCAYIVWDIQLMTRPTYRYAVTPSDIMLGVLLIRIDFVYYILTFIKKYLCKPKCWLRQD